MQSLTPTDPLILLYDIELQCKSILGKQKIDNTLNKDLWSGLGFLVEQYQLLIQSDYISEIVDSHFWQNISQVPGAKPWLIGLINLRGQPLPVIDLQAFLYHKPTIEADSNRLVVIKYKRIYSGLIVNKVFGLKQFEKPLRIHRDNIEKENNCKLDQYVENYFSDNEIYWGEFSIPSLEINENFLNASRY